MFRSRLGPNALALSGPRESTRSAGERCATVMSGPPARRPRLLYAASGHHVSLSAMEALFAHVREEGVPEAASRSTYARERAALAHGRTDFGPLLQRIKIDLPRGKSFDLWVQHPLAMLQITCEQNPAFRETVVKAIDGAEGRMKIAVYNDEIDPGKELAARHARKIEVVYWSFLDFGFPALANENAWFVLFACRSDLRAEVDGGMSHLLKESLRFFFGRPDGHDLRDGVQFSIRVTAWSRLLFASVNIMNNDELAHKGITRAKGACGFKSCSMCLNVHDHKYADPSGRMIPNTSLETHRFILHTDESIVRTLTVLKDIRCKCVLFRFAARRAGRAHSPSALIGTAGAVEVITSELRVVGEWTRARGRRGEGIIIDDYLP